MHDYERIARVIRYLQDHHADQPDLATLSAQTGLSASRFHRLFTTWAGITPKDFLQCLTLAHAKRMLASGQSVLAASLEAGLSGPARLHDLCVSLESASPGELKNGGADTTIRGGFSETPFGLCLLAENVRGICHLSFIDRNETAAAWNELEGDWPRAKLVRDERAAAQWVDRIFKRASDSSAKPGIRLFVEGTPFQVQVWRALLEVQAGELTTYGRLAERIGKPTAARAVGAAVGSNAISYLIPCHRVIRESGVIGEYRWGSIRKRAMIAWEARG